MLCEANPAWHVAPYQEFMLCILLKCTHTAVSSEQTCTPSPWTHTPFVLWLPVALFKGLTLVVVLKVEETALVIHSPHLAPSLPVPRLEPTTFSWFSNSLTIRQQLPRRYPLCEIHPCLMYLQAMQVLAYFSTDTSCSGWISVCMVRYH